MRKIAKFAIIILLGAICIFASCNNNKPMQFDKERWTQSGGDPFNGNFFLGDDFLVKGNTRYRMALWLEQNYSFDDKSLNDVLEKFFIIPDTLMRHHSWNLERVKNTKLLKIVTRHLTFAGFENEMPIWVGWLEFHFDENFIVSKVYNVRFPYRAEEETRRRIQ